MLIYLALLFLLSGLVCWHLVGYPLVLGLLGTRMGESNKLKASEQVPKTSVEPLVERYFVSIIVPTYNEAGTIRDRIRNLGALNYPADRYEVLIVDSGSDDGTVKQVELAISELDGPKVRIVREDQRRGKASAINEGVNRVNGNIVLVTDANAEFEPDVLQRVLPHFDDPDVGAVGGQVVLPDASDGITASAGFYIGLRHLMNSGEMLIDSACTFVGNLNAWRPGIARADTSCLTEDLEMAVSIRRAGYKIVYEPDALVYEPAPTQVNEQVNVNKRRIVGTLQTVFKHWDYLLVPRDMYGLVIFSSRKLLPMLSPFLLLLISVLYLLAGNLTIVLIHGTLSVLLFSGLLVSLIKVKRAQNRQPSEMMGAFSLARLWSMVKYLLINEYTILVAWRDFLLGEYSVLWQKSTTDR